MMYKQISKFMETKISACIKRFRKAHGIEHSVKILLEKLPKTLDKVENTSKYLTILIL